MYLPRGGQFLGFFSFPLDFSAFGGNPSCFNFSSFPCGLCSFDLGESLLFDSFGFGLCFGFSFSSFGFSFVSLEFDKFLEMSLKVKWNIVWSVSDGKKFVILPKISKYSENRNKTPNKTKRFIAIISQKRGCTIR